MNCSNLSKIELDWKIILIVITALGFLLDIFCRKDKESYLKNLARDNTQLLMNEIWKVRNNDIFLLVLECV